MKEKFDCSDNARRIITSRYSDKKDNGDLETPEEVFRRVARTLAEVERNYGAEDDEVEEYENAFYTLMVNKMFTPAGRTLANAGSSTPLIPNCLVLHIEDSMYGITETLKVAALHQQVGCGLGFPFHSLRPVGTLTKRTQGEASGPVSFIVAYDQMFATIKQQKRHGANMATFHISHPDVLDFISCKDREGDIRNFNISVMLTDEFMELALRDDDRAWYCEWDGEVVLPRRVDRNSWNQVESYEPVRMTPRQILEVISTQAWKNGEPGVMFYDRVQETNPLPGKGEIQASNPCGEQFLHDGANCNLGSLNLSAFVVDGEIDTLALRQATRLALRMLDNTIDIMEFPTEGTAQVSKEERRVGLGIMGLADMLIKMGLPYDSEKAREAAGRAMFIINDVARYESMELAKQKGPFGSIEDSVYGTPIRNVMRTTIAPTGSISMIFDVSGGVEPYFALKYRYENILGGKEQLSYTNPLLEDALEGIELSFKDKQTIERTGSIQSIEAIPEDIKAVFRCSMDIDPRDHVLMQSRLQQHVDNSVSKTINLPEDATVDDIMNSWFLGWRQGLKSMTVYRNNSRQVQVLNLEDKTCPECETELVRQEACYKCPECGYGLCG